MRLYHFTNEEKLEQILENGCINLSNEGVVWLTKNKEIEAQQWTKSDNAKFRISVSLLNISHFGKTAPRQQLLQGAGDWYTTKQPILEKLWVDVEWFKNNHWGVYKGLSYKNKKRK